MAGEGNEYPRRPAFYAYKLTRLMFKTALANSIGPEACHLIIQIAFQEDATRYSKAVTFYNEQLLPVCGFTNVKALDRARRKAVESGWLRYIPGGKGVAGKYFTTVPPQYADYDDGSIDESAAAVEFKPDPPVSLPATGKETGDKRETNGREVPDKRATINPSPSPNPEYKENKQNAHAEEASPAEPFSTPRQFCINPQVTSIAIGKEVIEYHEDALRWEAEFISRWNKLPGVNKRLKHGLDYTLKKHLENRLCDPDWDWKQAFSMFPLPTDTTWMPTMSWFLKPDSVSKILDGNFQRFVKHAPEKVSASAVANFTFDEKDLED